MQEFKAFSVTSSPKMPVKFQTARLRSSIDSLRNIVVPLENSSKNLLNETLKQQQQQ